ncbi:aspartate dehydrogenase [Amaricoccus macauensis]|uniref:L-aspartate dehydrogenase n=1 Tax=Amaricoccus macauensis TaxID=57001 RepID=A0A840SJ44_9RHOB|nr:aspartate dehydrogenase [Amaricoccus macauensis]MBB5221907.1 aspartate dehydrogenase [Amaricoccus macauensis]
MTSASPVIVSLGFGAMAQSLAASLAAGRSGLRLAGFLLPAERRRETPEGMTRWTTVDTLIEARPDLVVECATHAAVRETVPPLLAAGIDVVIVSIGALGDPATIAKLEEAARRGGAKATAVSGAIAGLDVLRAGALAGLESVTYVGRKPPAAWAGTPAETILDLAGLAEATTFYEGNAVDAARDYPKNTNVTAAVALAGVGFEKTRVRLVADPGAVGNTHELEARGAFGDFRIVLNNKPLPENPKTSWLAALSVEQAVLRHFSSLEV